MGGPLLWSVLSASVTYIDDTVTSQSTDVCVGQVSCLWISVGRNGTSSPARAVVIVTE